MLLLFRAKIHSENNNERIGYSYWNLFDLNVPVYTVFFQIKFFVLILVSELLLLFFSLCVSGFKGSVQVPVLIFFLNQGPDSKYFKGSGTGSFCRSVLVLGMILLSGEFSGVRKRGAHPR